MATFVEGDNPRLATRLGAVENGAQQGHILNDSFHQYGLTEESFSRMLKAQLKEWSTLGVTDFFCTIPQKFSNYYSVVAREQFKFQWWAYEGDVCHAVFLRGKGCTDMYPPKHGYP
jgi:hypothetical protein